MIYLDYQATTPLAPEARAAMLPWLGGGGGEGAFGNPHSPHRAGRAARAAVELARDAVLTALSPAPPPGRLFFTGGATEALNWAIAGTWARRPAARGRVVTVATEHACVLDAVAALAEDGAEIVVLPVGPDGRPDLAAAAAAIDGRTALVAAMLVNNEVGTIGDVGAIGALARAAGAAMICDAVQGFGRVPLPIASCDLIAVSAHKVHGPIGIGALWARRGAEPAPLLHGGGQEGGLRSGTLSPLLCAGFGAAAALLARRMDEDAAHVAALAARAREAFGPGWAVNADGPHRYSGNLSLRREGLDAARLIAEVRDVAFSAGSACASGSGRPSYVLRAIGLTEEQARATIRVGFGRYTTTVEIARAAALVNAAAARQEDSP